MILKQQMHMTLSQRAEAFNLGFNKNISALDVRLLYHGAGISKQRYVTTLGPPKPTPEKMEASRIKIELAKNEIRRLKLIGYDVFQLDASIFSPDSFIPSAWAPIGKPQSLPFKWSSKKYVAVFAAISEQSGCALAMYKVGAAFKGDDIADFLARLRARIGKHKKIAVFWDNASIHSRPAREVAPGLKIPVIWNAPYRPDLNGIEFFWRRVKHVYRKEITRLRVNQLDWDPEQLVKECIKDIGFECAKGCATQGWKNLMNAEIKPDLL
jgi:transposase